jgi:ankyrin repeat protein
LKTRDARSISANNGSLPIHAAVGKGHITIVTQFHDSTEINLQRGDGRQLIHLAALKGHVDIFNYLKAKGAKIKPDLHGYLPIHLAAVNGCLRIVVQFSEVEEINARSETGVLPIHLAARGDHLETFVWLRSHGSALTPDEEGCLPSTWQPVEGVQILSTSFEEVPIFIRPQEEVDSHFIWLLLADI